MLIYDSIYVCVIKPYDYVYDNNKSKKKHVSIAWISIDLNGRAKKKMNNFFFTFTSVSKVLKMNYKFEYEYISKVLRITFIFA